MVQTYRLAAGSDPEALAWLIAFHGWCHAIDDHVDDPGSKPAGVVDLCVAAVPIMSCGFYSRHASVLGPVIAGIAEQYRMSLRFDGEPIGDALRIAGNQAVLVVAYLQGGIPLQRLVSERLWPLVKRTQLS